MLTSLKIRAGEPYVPYQRTQKGATNEIKNYMFARVDSTVSSKLQYQVYGGWRIFDMYITPMLEIRQILSLLDSIRISHQSWENPHLVGD